MRPQKKLSLKERIKKAAAENVEPKKYNPDWIKQFKKEKKHLLKCLPGNLVRRIEHFGSTAIPNMPAKPIVDLLVETASLRKTKKIIVPILELQGYEYFWRRDVKPAYAWFIKRNVKGERTHHIHVVESDSALWERLYFRDYLIEFPSEAKQYAKLKLTLSKKFPEDRIAYTNGKAHYITAVTQKAKSYYSFSSC